MRSPFLLLRQKIVALLVHFLPTNSPPRHLVQCNSVNSSVINSWLFSFTSSPIALPSSSSPMFLAIDTISLTAGSTGTFEIPQSPIRQRSPA
ncbi:hypothetical protein AVEN_83974-1 [Araneus ventricosus]|uniref:Uncharacterized protein n=1 Tax=Araneus ventricosus TaxID=182803 RepID=A0A4Y2BRH9_ARAVE|nr:hypothetical protein AVEN_83974-1 [Araneus ventricosus]